jgi:uncharacterized protein (DUF305 family)
MAIPGRFLWIAAVVVVTAASARAQAPHHHGETSAFEKRMAESMNRMDRDMSIAHTGDPDRDFAAMMIPHHQGAIDMAKAELQYGRNPVLRRLAEGIIVEQQQEIELMRRELRRLPSQPRPDAH